MSLANLLRSLSARGSSLRAPIPWILPALLFLAAAPELRAQNGTTTNQRFHVGDASTQAANMTFTCAFSYINATSDIILSIPGGFNGQWDTSITAPSITGSGSAKTTGTVSYPGGFGNRRAVINVTALFLAGEQIVVSGMRFTNFTAPSAPVSIQYSFDGGVGFSNDAFTIRIGATPAISSDADQFFNVGDGTTAISPIEVTESAVVGNGSIWSTTNIRIRIPAGLQMEWNTTDTVASCSGSAVTFGHVLASPTVTYPNTKTVQIPVQSDFGTSRLLRVTGLSFRNFNGVSGPLPLELIVNAGTAVAATDDMDKQIGGTPSISSAANQAFTVGDPATAISTIQITEATGVATITTANDIRIEIPGAFPMTWNTGDNVAACSGTAVTNGRVAAAPIVTFANGNRTVIIPVVTNFAPDEVLNVSGLSFFPFTGSSGGADTLDLEVDGDPAPESTDNRTIAVGAPTLLSAGSQIFQVGDPDTAMLAATVTDDASTPRVKAATGIRIRIPAGFNMVWDNGTTVATCTGSAVSGGRISASPTVTFEDADRTIVVPVTSDFLPGDAVTISGLVFSGFGAPSLPDNLELVVNAFGTTADEDTFVIAVGGAPTISSGADQAFTVNDPATGAQSVTVTDADGFPTITAANDIRIRIPAGFNMRWDPSSNVPTCSGSAVAGAKVAANPVVTFELSNTVVVVPVIGDFAVNEFVTISGLTFQNFSGPSAPDNLELEIDGAGTAAAFDDKTIAVGQPTIASAASQVFGTGDPSTPASTITVTDDGSTARITAGGDIRIRIPAGFNMEWDTSITTPAFGGATGKVLNTVTYEDAGATLVVDVTADFTTGESLAISGLSFTNFTMESPADNLELEVNNLNTVASVDSQTIIVSNRPTVVSAVTADLTQNGLLDRLIVTFSEDIDGASGSIVTGGGFTAAGYVIAVGSQTASNVVTFVLAEIGIPDTGATPAFTYDFASGDIRDLTQLAMRDTGPFTVLDGAPPLIIGFSANDTDANSFLNEVVFTYSEPLLAGQEDLSDWTLIDADGVTNLLAGLTDGNVAIAGNLVTITLSNGTGTTGLPRYQYFEDGLGGAIADLAGNFSATTTNNSSPVADAGNNQTVSPRVVFLDGSGSTDADGQPLTFAWVQTAGPAAPLTGAGTAMPSFLATGTSSYTFELTVDDGISSSVDTVSVTVLNVPPIADAGFGQTVLAGPGIGLDGTASLDINGDVLTFAWIQTQGTAVPIAGAMTSTPTIDTTGLNEVLEFELTVTDPVNQTDTDTVVIIVNAIGNGVPTAHAGPDQVGVVGSLISLDGRLSTDLDGDALTYAWTPGALLTGPNTATPSFTPVVRGVYTFQLIVTDTPGAASVADEVTVLVSDGVNLPPVAVASRLSPAADPMVGDLIALDASGSSDPEGTSLQYAWVRKEGPMASLTNPVSAQPSFGPILPGVFVFDLIVSDGVQSSLPDTLIVQVKRNAVAVIPDAVATIDAADDPDGDGRVSSVTAPIVLDGTASTGDGPLGYNWVQIRGPNVVLTAPTTSLPSFTPGVAGLYEFALVVTDVNAVRDFDRLEVVVDTPANEVPTADAGADGSGKAGQTITLDGSASFDPSADADGVTDFTNGLIAFWTQVSGPHVVVSDHASPSPTFVPTVGGVYVFELTVSDGTSGSRADTVTVAVSGATPGGGGGGGGSCALLGFEACLLLLAFRLRRRRGIF